MKTLAIFRSILLVLALGILSACGGGSPLDIFPTFTPPAPTSSVPTSPPTLILPTLSNAPTSAPTATTAPAGPGVIFGAQVDAGDVIALCNPIQQMGIKATTLWVQWTNVEPRKGAFNWDDLDRALQNFLICGINDIGFHFQSRSTWATLPIPTPPAGVEAASAPPRNPDDYYNVVLNMATHFKGRVRRYSIENEAMSPAAWPGSTASYFDLLKTAQRAIKNADPDALVLDSGTGSRAYGLLLANQLLQSGQAPSAVQYVNDYYARDPIGNQTPNLKSTADLQTFLASTQFQSQIQVAPLQRSGEWTTVLYSKNTLYDANQIHYYGPWQKLTDVINYVRTQLNTGGKIRPLEIWELGYGWQDRPSYDPNTHAQDMVKLLTIAAGEGVNRIMYSPLVDRPERGTPGLLKGDQFTPAGVAYRVTAQVLAGSTTAQHIDLGNHDVWAYRFVRNGRETFVVWGMGPAVVRIPTASAKVLVTDVRGGAVTLSPQTITVTQSPLFIQATP